MKKIFLSFVASLLILSNIFAYSPTSEDEKILQNAYEKLNLLNNSQKNLVNEKIEEILPALKQDNRAKYLITSLHEYLQVSEILNIENVENTTNVYIQTKIIGSRTYFLGPEGGCYYINSNGNKTYVERTICHSIFEIDFLK